jgi:hypothetical protein
VALVQSPRFLDWDPHQIEFIENKPERANSSFQKGGKAQSKE